MISEYGLSEDDLDEQIPSIPASETITPLTLTAQNTGMTSENNGAKRYEVNIKAVRHRPQTSAREH